MKALEVLHNRVSHARLGEPGPSPEQLEVLLRAALRAPDHGQLRPWRFLTIAGEARQRLGEVFAQALLAEQPQATPEALAKARELPLRAPMLVLVVARLQAHAKVPEIEQWLSAGCAAHGLLQGAYAQGLGAIWRTGAMAHDPLVRQALGLADEERIVGFIYLGTPLSELRRPAPLQLEAFVSSWTGV